MIEILQKAGLTPGESKVYLALLKLGQTTTGPIVKEAKVTTSKSYKILDRLEQKGLVSHVFKKKIKHFKAANPSKVLELFSEKENKLREQRKDIENLLPQLIEYQKQIQENHEAEVYHGVEGLKTLFDEQKRTLEKGEQLYAIGITHFNEYSTNVAEYFKRLQTQRDNKGLISNFLLGENARNSFQYMNSSKLCNVRYLPHASLVAINIYRNVTIIGIFIGTPILFKIKSKEVAENFINYFELLWKQAKE